ncbi:TIGR02444 family protein [Vreelandella rituensis]|uniref:TIGR02444 family protein n=1 Tax=Vreelandella rituensis TaxID=2282306 RepID=A0A368U8I2_9GAMM|nr:TIGR02444 family protein [Halomonas rituensis]RCV93489.1 TIGR02444 family protein [Halomonas rituensis]
MGDSNRLAHLEQTPLWDFALKWYSCPGVEAACLRLQDEAGVDVCELLFHGWLYSHGLQASPELVEKYQEERLRWQHEVTAVLRELRRGLKTEAATRQGVMALRETLKQAELLAERENLQRWQEWALDETTFEARLRVMPVSPGDSAWWLKNQVVTQDQADRDEALDYSASTLESAWQTLGRQLDPLHVAR